MRLLIALVVWAACIAGAFELSSAVAGSIGNTTTTASSGSASSGSAPAASSFDASDVKATDSDSLFRAANLAKALAIVRKHFGTDAEVTDATVYPGYLDLTIVKAGQENDVYVDAQGAYTPTSMGSAAGDQVFALSQLPLDGPQTLALRIAKYGGTPESKLAYMVVNVDSTTNRIEWLVYPLQGNRVEYFQAASPTSLIHGFLASG